MSKDNFATQEKMWREESDARSLANVKQIQNDPKRMKGAKRGAARLQKEMVRQEKEIKKETAAIKKVAGMKDPTKKPAVKKPAVKKPITKKPAVKRKKKQMIKLNIGCGSRILEDYVNIDKDSIIDMKRRYPDIKFPKNKNGYTL